MSCEVKVCSVVSAVDFAPAEGEKELNVTSSLCIVSKLLVVVITKVFSLDAKVLIILHTVFFKIIVKLCICALFAEGLELHLLKLNCSEGEVAGGNFISEGFTDLSDAEGELYVIPKRYRKEGEMYRFEK